MPTAVKETTFDFAVLFLQCQILSSLLTLGVVLKYVRKMSVVPSNLYKIICLHGEEEKTTRRLKKQSTKSVYFYKNQGTR